MSAQGERYYTIRKYGILSDNVKIEIYKTIILPAFYMLIVVC
jgi:hypothetical protein